jgi:hypothetical protein
MMEIERSDREARLRAGSLYTALVRLAARPRERSRQLLRGGHQRPRCARPKQVEGVIPI